MRRASRIPSRVTLRFHSGLPAFISALLAPFLVLALSPLHEAGARALDDIGVTASRSEVTRAEPDASRARPFALEDRTAVDAARKPAGTDPAADDAAPKPAGTDPATLEPAPKPSVATPTAPAPASDPSREAPPPAPDETPFYLVAAELELLHGHWEGAIDLPGTRLAIDLDFSAAPGGRTTGDISIPAQGAKDMPLSNIRWTDGAYRFDLHGPPGDPAFKGTLSADTRTLSGDFTQSGQTFPFHVDRAAPPEEVAKDALAGWGDLVRRSMKDWKVPGLAFAIVKDGKVILSEGYGQRDVERNLPVTTHTLFAIGSSTKAFTTFVMGTLVDEGKLDWDKPVVNYVPSFRLSDADASMRITVRDLVTHRSGLPRHDLVWYNSTISRKELIERLPYLEPFRDLRSEFHYQNLMFLAAGYLVEQITGQSWEDAVQHRIFDRIGMSHTNFSVAESQKSQDFALPYEEKDGAAKEMPFRVITNMGPAGSINSTIEDMTEWVLLQVGKGKHDGASIINESILADMHTPHMAISAPIERPELGPMSYGMGWFVQPYRGHNRIHHGGNIDGFSAMVSFLPQDGIGMVALSNLNGSPLPELLMRHAMDRLLKLEPIEWVDEGLAKKTQAMSLDKEAQGKKETVRKTGTRPAHKLEEYAGEYSNPGYGPLTVALVDGRLELTYNNIVTPLEHWHYEVFNGAKGAKDPVFEDMKFMFLTNMKGDVDGVDVPLEPEVKDIVFKRSPDKRLSDPHYLQQFLGDYELGPQVVTFGLQGTTLTLTVPGQPTYRLAPDRENQFNLEALSVISVRFTIDPKDGVTEAVFNQPNGVFTAKRKK